MTNSEKTRELVRKYKVGESISQIVNDRMYDCAYEMAQWKDQQFKEYLEMKKNFIPTSKMELYDKITCTEFIEGIINGLFGE